MRFEGTDSEGLDRRTVLQSVGVAGASGLGVGPAVGDGPNDGEQPPTLRGSVEQVYVKDAVPGATVTLYGPDDSVLGEKTTDEKFGSQVFTDLEPAEGYQVTQTVDGTESPRSDPVRVLPVDYTPPQELYDSQTLDEGFGYIEVRDGTTLAEQVILPDEPEPPYPTLIIHSGYEPSVSPSGADVINDVVVDEYGYAVVGVNMRGSTCSGGRFDLGEQLQLLDGYDMIETVAAQDWVDGDVGLIGASFSGFTQLFVAATQPPSLAAIAPGHPIGDFYRDTTYPGGLKNATFATIWAQDRDTSFEAGGDQGNVDQRIANGDEICEENQELRPHNIDIVDQLNSVAFDTGLFEKRGIFKRLDQIDVPTALVVSWQDEQTGGRAARLYEQLSDDIQTRFIGTSGSHYEYIGPDVIDELIRFFSYYVGEEVPEGDEGPYEEALAAYEAEDEAKIFWEMSTNSVPRFEKTFPTWPPESTETWTLYFQPDGRLGESPPRPALGKTSTYDYDPVAPVNQLISRTSTRGVLDWPQQPDESHVAFVSDPLDEDRVCLGSGYVELWLASTSDDTDVQVTVSEVRPDGEEMFVQTGWLRASHRKENPERSKPRRPFHTHDPEDQEFLPDDGFVNMRVELFPFGHTFRAGSRIKVAVETPGGNRDLWGLSSTGGSATNEIAHTEALPSNVALPLLPDEQPDVASRPPCGSVQNQPCRDANLDLPAEWGTVTGEVTDGDGPVPAAPVEFVETGTESGDTESGEPTSTAAGTTATAEDGTYAAELPPGEYEVVIDTAEFEVVREQTTVSAGGSSTVDLQVTPRERGSLTGTVTAGEPLAGVDLAFQYDDETTATVTSDEEGTYEVELPAGITYDVGVDEPEYESYSATVTVEPDTTELFNVSLLGPQVALGEVTGPSETVGAGEPVVVQVLVANEGDGIAEDLELTASSADGAVADTTMTLGSLTGRTRIDFEITPGTAGPAEIEFALSSSNAGSDSAVISLDVAPPPLVGGRRPKSLGNDGLYDDVRGDGELDINDVQALFNNLDNPDLQANAQAFDFSGQGGAVDILDVQALFERL